MLYHHGLAEVPGLALPPFDGQRHFDAFQNYVVRAGERDRLREHLERDGVETLVSWPRPVWQHRGLTLGDLHLPRTEEICREVLSLPLSAETTPIQVATTVRSIRAFFFEDACQSDATQHRGFRRHAAAGH